MTWVPRLPEKRAAPVRCLAGRGVARITRAGTMPHTLRGEAHGGEYPLHRYVRLEKRANKTEMQAAPGTHCFRRSLHALRFTPAPVSYTHLDVYKRQRM